MIFGKRLPRSSKKAPARKKAGTLPTDDKATAGLLRCMMFGESGWPGWENHRYYKYCHTAKEEKATRKTIHQTVAGDLVVNQTLQLSPGRCYTVEDPAIAQVMGTWAEDQATFSLQKQTPGCSGYQGCSSGTIHSRSSPDSCKERLETI